MVVWEVHDPGELRRVSQVIILNVLEGKMLNHFIKSFVIAGGFFLMHARYQPQKANEILPMLGR